MFRLSAALALSFILARPAAAQVDPTRRRLIELGYDQAFIGPTANNAYLFYYANEPDFLRKGANLRLALAPTYLDSEYGIKDGVAEHVDLGIALAGGGFADNYYEMRQGHYFKEESFTGYGATAGLAVYPLLHQFGPLPLNGYLSVKFHQALYEKTSRTAPGFALPPDHLEGQFRAGLRLGGQPPRLRPMQAGELSVWYQGLARDHTGGYGFNGDRTLARQPNYYWARSLINFMQSGKRYFAAEAQAGTSSAADRISGYRLGGQLPFVSEFALQIPGFYNGELTARRYALFGGSYGIPVMPDDLLWARIFGTTANVTYQAGEGDSHPWNTGAGFGFRIETPGRACLAEIDYAHGFDALRSGHRGTESLALLVQIDLQAIKEQVGIKPPRPAIPSRPGTLPTLEGLGNLFR